MVVGPFETKVMQALLQECRGVVDPPPTRKNTSSCRSNGGILTRLGHLEGTFHRGYQSDAFGAGISRLISRRF